MTDEEKSDAAIDGYVNGVWFRVCELLGKPWSEVRYMTIPRVREALLNRKEVAS